MQLEARIKSGEIVDELVKTKDLDLDNLAHFFPEFRTGPFYYFITGCQQ